MVEIDGKYKQQNVNIIFGIRFCFSFSKTSHEIPVKQSNPHVLNKIIKCVGCDVE